MRIKYYEKIVNKSKLKDILKLLILCDNEFVPPLSARDSTSQKEFGEGDSDDKKDAPIKYFEGIHDQPAFLAEKDGHVIGFMSIKKDHVCEEIPKEPMQNIYITTIIVHPHHRNKGITNAFYQALLSKFKTLDIYTRTWSTNTSHIRILSSLKFYEHERKEDDRGAGIDTIYYHHYPVSRGTWQTLRQYRLIGNLLFLCMLTLLSVTFVMTWASTGQGMMHELSIAFATSLIASILCLLSDSMMKYKDSQNDEYINSLKSFGIENLQFRKDQLLENIMPKCKNEIWITGYRLIITGKRVFCEALCEACRKNRGLKVYILVVPPWSETFRLVYGTEDVTDNYIKIFKTLCSCYEKYDTKLVIRYTNKPIFNDTYKVDNRFITSPYLHCTDGSKGKITAKDFFSLDINDPHKKLYELIYNDYMSVWEKSEAELSISKFMEKFGNDECFDYSNEKKQEMLKDCFVERVTENDNIASF